MAGIMLRSLIASLNTERTPLPCVADPLASLSRGSRSSSGTDARSSTGKAKHSPNPVRVSPYPALARSTPGFGSGAGAKRIGVVRPSQPLRRTASLHGGDSLASLQQAADDARVCKPQHKRRSPGRPLRPAPSFVNALPLDVLVRPPPALPVKCDITVRVPTPVVPAPVVEPPKPSPLSRPPLNPPRRRSSLAPEPSAPKAFVVSQSRQVPLPSPPTYLTTSNPKKKREPLAQRTLRRTFERTTRGAQVKVHGAHAAMRMMSEAEEEAVVAASVVVESEEEDVCMSDSWVEVERERGEEMDWSLIEQDEC